MALTADMKKKKLAVLDKKIVKAEAAVAALDALRAERDWIAAAPEVAKTKRAAKKAAPSAEAPASA